jgi:mycothiol synthase
MITIREVATDAQLEAWRSVRAAVLPDERVPTAEEMRAQVDRERDKLLLVAELDGVLAGSGTTGRSSLRDCVGLTPRVLAPLRRRGVGTALYHALEAHAVALGFREAIAVVDDDGSAAFAGALGFREVDRQVEQRWTPSGIEPSPLLPAGVEVVTIAERPGLLENAYPLAVEAYADMATFRPATITLDEWLHEEATLPAGSFVALCAGEIVGFSGLNRDPDDPSRAEDGLTAVRRDWRRRGLASALKRLELSWAAGHGIRLVYTWTQPGNDGMRAVNERLGYQYGAVASTMWRQIAP